MANIKTPTPEQLDRERRVVELRRAGAIWDDIAKATGYKTPMGAWQAFQRAMKRTLVEAGTEEIRQLELDRLDHMQRAVWPRVLNGDTHAIQTALRILDRRARYLGLDAPLKQEITVDTADAGMIDREVARLVSMLEGNHETSQERK